jgi:hypothetical protein
MILTRFQADLISYLRQNAELILDHIFHAQTSQYTLIDDILPLIRDYLDLALKKDISLHEPRSVGYHRFQDILIELHVAKGKFAETLRKEIHYLNGLDDSDS